MAADRPNLLFLVDPAAGGGHVRSRLEAALRRSDAFPGSPGDPFRILELPGGSAARGLHEAGLGAAALAEQDGVVAVGGDGTVTAVARFLLETGVDVPLGVVPLGTGNAFAHSLGMGTVPSALAAIAAGWSRPLDVMRTDRPSASVALVSISAGFEGRYVARYSRLRGRGRLLGTAHAIPALASRSRDVGLVADGRILVRPGVPVFNVGLYNMRAYAGGLIPWPGADPSDGAGDAAVVLGRWEYVRALVRGGTARTRWTRAELESETPIQIDGDAHPAGRVTVRIDPGALRVLVPHSPV
jgi:diacylglycerol kinase (ATP)